MPLTTLVAGARTTPTLPPARRALAHGWWRAARRARRSPSACSPGRVGVAHADNSLVSSRHRPGADRPSTGPTQLVLTFENTHRRPADRQPARATATSSRSAPSRSHDNDGHRAAGRRHHREGVRRQLHAPPTPTATPTSAGASASRSTAAATATGDRRRPLTAADDHGLELVQQRRRRRGCRAGRSGSAGCCRSLGISVLFGSLVLIVAAWPEGPEYVLALRFLRTAWVVGLVGTFIYVVALSAAREGRVVRQRAQPVGVVRPVRRRLGRARRGHAPRVRARRRLGGAANRSG